MKIEKLPSGSFRIRKTYNGKRYSLTFNRKPTKDMIRQELFRRIQNDKESAKRNMPFLEAAKKYTDSKKNVLSPTTIREYMNIPDRLSDWFVKLDIDKITQNDINKQINELALKRKPKTVRNYHGFISAVLRTFRPDFMIYTHLPQKIKKEPYIPSDDDIRRLTEAAAGTIFEIPLKLACYGLRRSEICALELSDINDTKVSVNKAMVLDHDKKWVIKTTKTVAGTRIVPIDKDLASMIRKQGYVYDGNPSSISDWMSDTEKKLGMQHFTLHKCRHYFASKLLADGVDMETVKDIGGWESDYVLQANYLHRIKDEEKEKRILEIISGAFSS